MRHVVIENFSWITDPELPRSVFLILKCLLMLVNTYVKELRAAFSKDDDHFDRKIKRSCGQRIVFHPSILASDGQKIAHLPPHLSASHP